MKVCAKCGSPYKGFDVCENCGSTEFKIISKADEDNLNDVINNTENSGDDNETAEIYEDVVMSETNNAESKKKTTHKKLSKKAKIAIISVVAVTVLLVAIVLGWYFYTTYANSINILNDTVSVEYGEEYIPSVEDFVELTDAITLDNTYIEYELEYKEVLDEETGEIIETYTYPEVGEYDITVYHSFDFKLFGLTVFTSIISNEAEIVVEDTIAPEFQEEVATKITTYQDIEIDADTLAEKFDVYDLSEVELIIDDSLIDYETVGEYETTVCAKDVYNNATTINVVVKVKEPSVSVEPSSVELTVGETQELTVKVRGLSEDDTTFSSDDESVATVSDDGVITAVKKGTATITVENNGKKNTVTVTVTNETETSDTSSSSSNNTNNNSASSNKTVTSSSNTSSNTSNTNSSSTNNSSKSSTNTSNSSTSSSSTKSSEYYCYEGGSVHAYNANNLGYTTLIGYYDTYKAADNAITAYFNSISDEEATTYSNLLITQCLCGKYIAVIK